ncbi:EAL domain-containing protein [Roseibium denhamense]|uniref:Diguanylate phosphodiesterase n=1 Tax=Roseibium denhamense TaxID=76305 RepID=A0ABY1P4X7_9HYPH|nr:EAL domain-containing protein [Roseibium denhamense]MTI07201.1 EAL domain-containing protein [Roseibium denhamense]SMP26631.1 diguanylate phosphodiesterase [Roseibium denhamense]
MQLHWAEKYTVQISEMANFLARQPVLAALQRGLAATLPLIMVGALALLVLHPPFPRVKEWMTGLFGPGLEATLQILIASTFGIAALLALSGYAYVYTTLRNARERMPIASPVLSIMVAVTCFFVLVAPTDQPTLIAAISLSFGLPVALLVAVSATWLFLKLAQLPLFRLRSKAVGHEVMIGDIFFVMPAAVVTILVFGLLKAVLLQAGSTDIIAEFNSGLARSLTSGEDTLGFGLLYMALSQVFWLFGIHGPNVLQAVHDVQLVPASIANNLAVLEGGEPVHIFTSQFFDLQHMGGSGATLGLVAAMLLFSKLPSSRNFAILAAFPALCNVNEPLLYGLPIVLNPIFAIPFLLVPIINTLVMYAAMSWDLMPLTSYQVAWTTPAVINGYAVTGSVNGAIVQAVCLAISILVYTPFVRLSERVSALKAQGAMQALLVGSTQDEGTGPRRLLSRSGDQGRLALSLAGDLEYALKQQDQLFLEYQPQICLQSTRVVGAEALLRWEHPVYGRVPPPVTVRLAEELGIMSQLGLRVLQMACAQRKIWRGDVDEFFFVSVNVAPAQILSGSLDKDVFACLDETFLPTHCLKLEITESTILIPDDTAISTLERLREHGVRISLDDFGMGHTSLRYLKALPVDEVKIDRSLSLSNESGVSEHIIQSILDLSRSLDFETIVEGVESEEQLARLKRLGCSRFQGYYFCRPGGADTCLQYIRSIQEKADRAA